MRVRLIPNFVSIFFKKFSMMQRQLLNSVIHYYFLCLSLLGAFSAAYWLKDNFSKQVAVQQ